MMKEDNPDMAEENEKRPPHEMQRILSLKIPIIVTLADRKMTMSEVLDFTPGQVIEFEKSAIEPVDLYVNDRKIGYGEVIVIGDKFGLKILKVGSQKERVLSMGDADTSEDSDTA